MDCDQPFIAHIMQKQMKNRILDVAPMASDAPRKPMIRFIRADEKRPTAMKRLMLL